MFLYYKLAQAIKCYVGSSNNDNIVEEDCNELPGNPFLIITMAFSCKKVTAGKNTFAFIMYYAL